MTGTGTPFSSTMTVTVSTPTPTPGRVTPRRRPPSPSARRSAATARSPGSDTACPGHAELLRLARGCVGPVSEDIEGVDGSYLREKTQCRLFVRVQLGDNWRVCSKDYRCRWHLNATRTAGKWGKDAHRPDEVALDNAKW